MDFNKVLTNVINTFVRNIKSNTLGYIVTSEKVCASNLMFNVYLSEDVYEKAQNEAYKEILQTIYDKTIAITR